MNKLIERHGKALFWLFGMFIPVIVILIQMLVGFVSSPLTILMITWFGIALFIYLGVYEE